jgi:predicted ribosome quality control (RQC) complex YloA/Tae2 family protein
VDSARTRAQTRARTALKKVERKVAAIRGDLARVESAPRLRREGQVLLCHLDGVGRGATSVRLLDESVDPPEWLDIALDPAREAKQIAQQRFERARKLERGIGIASTRLAEAEAEASALRLLLARLESEPLDELLAQADAVGVTIESVRAGKPKPQVRVSYRLFTGTGGQRVLVGKGAADNDTLTLTVARPHDHWLHVRGVAGSHVVVPLEKKATIGQELLLDAAHLAAHFSKQRGEPTVEIAHTERRFVRKPKGAAPGSVNVDRERVFVLRIERDRLARLLASEK